MARKRERVEEAAPKKEAESRKRTRRTPPAVLKKTAGKPISDEFAQSELNKLRARLAKDGISAIKKTPHTNVGKPYSAVSTGCSSIAMAKALLGGHGTLRKETGRQLVYDLSPKDIVAWLPIPSIIQPVKFTGKVWHLTAHGRLEYGSPPAAQRHEAACFDGLEVKYDDTLKLLTLKFRTSLVKEGYEPERSAKHGARAVKARGKA